MAKAQTRSLATSSEDVSSRRGELGRSAANPAGEVLVCDARSEQVEVVVRALATSGVGTRILSDPDRLEAWPGSGGCTLALVGVESPPAPGHASLALLRSLKDAGRAILAYADGLESWPVVARCHLLLAGAAHLLDSASPGFPKRLEEWVARHQADEEAERLEQRKVKGLMRDLGVVGVSKPMLTVFRAIVQIGVLSDLPTLLTGETGTGKECLARAVHRLDPKRQSGPFIALNCGALTPTLAESELFGHRRGAFTGADRERKGLVRAAHGGVLFLDEIGELSEPLQAKLLRVLQENRVLAVGEEHEVTVSVRVVAATNRDLAGWVREGRFRADLFHRLNVLRVHVPPLRERPEDVPSLVEFFLEKHRALRPRGAARAGADFLEALKLAELPGNVRQLESVICQTLVQGETDAVLGLADLPPDILRQVATTIRRGETPGAEPVPVERGYGAVDRPGARADVAEVWARLLDGNGCSLARSLACCERALLAEALQRTRGNRSQTARLLGITSRSVYNKVRKHLLNEGSLDAC